MFDSESAQLLRSAPEVQGLDPQEIPAILTRHYATLVSARLNGNAITERDTNSDWPLERIADTYELVTSLHSDAAARRASAFVAATAQQIIYRRSILESDLVFANVDRDRVDPTLSAALLFLISEQFADANEAASSITNRGRTQSTDAATLSDHIASLARGQMQEILTRASEKRSDTEFASLEEHALSALLQTLSSGIALLAARLLGTSIDPPGPDSFGSAEAAFRRVLSVSMTNIALQGFDAGHEVHLAYPGPHHLASLLLATSKSLAGAALVDIPPPRDADGEAWHRWLTYRARSMPFVWANHREAIKRDFYQTDVSSVVVLPTGAGKTTLSSVKIAGTLARSKKVVFLAPTHALVEQLTDDLQEMFPREIMSSVVSNDYDLVLQENVQLQSIEVMTPERCLTMLSFAPEAFGEVGLLVFDECHILSPSSGKIRRSIDSMLCLLGFLYVCPNADLLFLSAMVKNGAQFAEWIGSQTKKPCVAVDLLWKPSRQARGVVVYREKELVQAREAAHAVQLQEDVRQSKRAKGLRVAAERMLLATPWSIWGLEHNWLSDKATSYSSTALLTEQLPLAGSLKDEQIALTPNANVIASRIANSAAKAGLKTIVFVNTKRDAVNIATQISLTTAIELDFTEIERERWAALKLELGDLKHAILSKPMSAVPHNASMIRLERDLAERMFKRRNGAKVIVATPTLAQGLNLPAHLAILAGDKRSRANRKGREELEAHEILNAAARAGRAGHLANGMVLLVPEPIVTFSDRKTLDENLVKKLRSILPANDRCVTITDPLEVVLDSVMQGKNEDADVKYLVNRLAALSEIETVEDPTHMFDMRRSFAGFMASKRRNEEAFRVKLKRMRHLVSVEAQDLTDSKIVTLASRSGLQISLLLRLRHRLVSTAGILPVSVAEWLRWCFVWLNSDGEARAVLMEDVRRELLGACGLKKDAENIDGCLDQVLPGVICWIEGKPISFIEEKLGGDPESSKQEKRLCPRARDLIGVVIPRSVSFIMSLISHIVEAEDLSSLQDSLDIRVVACLGPAVRKGFDTPEKLEYANAHRSVFSRVQIHQMWNDLGYAQPFA